MIKIYFVVLGLLLTTNAGAHSLSFADKCKVLFLESSQANDQKIERNLELINSVLISRSLAMISVGDEVYKYELNDYQNSEYTFFVRKLNETGVFRITFSEPHSLYNEREEYAAIIECHK